MVKLKGVLKPFASNNQGWWRYERYTIDAANVLRPSAPPRPHQYDPWLEYAAIEQKRRTVEPGYASLLELGRQVRFRLRANQICTYMPTPESQDLILDWVNHHGLLGVLPAQCRRITLAPQWFDDHGTWVPGYLTYMWDGRGWATLTHTKETEAARRLPKGAKGTGRPVPPEVCPVDWPHPGVQLWRWQDNQWTEEQFYKSFSTFFPTVRPQDSETFPYPVPGSQEFWQQYGEPVETFCFWVEQFRQAAEVLSAYDAAKQYRTEDADVIERALEFMESLANGTGTKRVLAPTVSHVVVASSLLSVFAEMFLRDWESGRRVRHCQTCERVFVSDDRRAQYCTPTCRNTMQRRRQRQRAADDSLEAATE